MSDFIQTQPYEVIDFSGGVTDYPMGAASNKFARGENLIVIPYSDPAGGLIGKLYTRQGSEIYDETYYQIPDGSQRIQTLTTFEDTLLQFSKETVQYIDSGWQAITGPTSNEIFPSSATVNDVLSLASWNHHLFVTSDGFFRPQMIYPDSSNVLTLRTAGLPELASSPTVTAGSSGSGTYIYAFAHHYTYTVGTVVREMYGPVTYVTLEDATAPDSSTIAITDIPVLANATIHNYDTTNIKIKIFRTGDAQTTFFYIGEVTNGTTSYNDSKSDLTIQADNILLYTEGGSPEHEQPPLSKLVHVIGNKSYWAHTKEGSQVFSNRFYQSIPGILTAVPGDFFEEVDQAIIGMGSAKGNLILLCDGGDVYRVDGELDEFGRGGMFATKINDAISAACISAQGVVQTLDGLFWAGKDGIYFTDGFEVIKLNEDYDRTWASWVSAASHRSKIQGKYDSLRNRIVWTIVSSGSTDCDKLYVLHLEFGIKRRACFTVHSGGSNFAPTAIEFSGDEMFRADRRGYLFRHKDTLYTDPKIDIDEVPANWETAVIIYDYISPGFNFGTSFVRKFTPRVMVTLLNETSLSLQIKSINDNSSQAAELKPVRYRGGAVWGDPDVIWGDEDIVWNDSSLIDQQRRFPAGSLRCQYKQIELTNAFVAIASSDLLGTATVDAAAKTATLGSNTWLSTIIDYYIAFSSDNYAREYLITERSSDTVITFSDATNASPDASGLGWVIRGYPRGEVMSLLGYVIDFALMGMTQLGFRRNQTGEVGAAAL